MGGATEPGTNAAAAGDGPGSSSSPSPPCPSSRPWWASFWLHAAALAVVLLALVPLFDTPAPAFPDEGLYSAQAAALSDGSWSLPLNAPDIDPRGLQTPLVESAIRDGRQIPYARKPMYPLLLTPFFALGGFAGLLVASAVGTWLASVAAARLALRINRSYGVPTLWLLGIGSPLLFGAYLVIGHSIVAAVAGLLVLTIARVIDDRRPWWLPVLIALTAAVVMTRSEGVVLVAAAAGVVVAQGTSLRPWRMDWLHLAVGAILATTGAVAYFVDARLARAISGPLAGVGNVVEETDPLNAAWVSLLRPWFGTGSTATATSVLVVVGTVLAVALLRIMPTRPLMALALLVVAASCSVIRLFETPDLITGLLAVFPVLAAVALLRLADLKSPPVGRLGAITLVAAIALLLTIYSEGGTAEWGGRYFWILLPLVGPLVVLGLDRGRVLLPHRMALVAGVAVVVTALSTQVMGLRANATARARASEIVTESTRLADTGSPDRPRLIVVMPFRPSGIGRLFWREAVTGRDLLGLRVPQEIEQLVVAARTAGQPEILLVTDLSPEVFRIAVSPVLLERGWRTSQTRALGDTGFSILRLVAVTG